MSIEGQDDLQVVERENKSVPVFCPTMIYARNLQFIQHMGSPESLGPEAARIRNNLDLIIEKSSIAESNYNLLINIKTSNIEELEKRIAVANSFIVHATEELEKEQKVFHDLRQSLAQ